MERKILNLSLIIFGLIVFLSLSIFPNLGDDLMSSLMPFSLLIIILIFAGMIFGIINFLNFKFWVKIVLTIILTIPLYILWAVITAIIHGIPIV